MLSTIFKCQDVQHTIREGEGGWGVTSTQYYLALGQEEALCTERETSRSLSRCVTEWPTAQTPRPATSSTAGPGVLGGPGAPAAPPVGQAPRAGRGPVPWGTLCGDAGARGSRGSSASTPPVQVTDPNAGVPPRDDQRRLVVLCVKEKVFVVA